MIENPDKDAEKPAPATDPETPPTPPVSKSKPARGGSLMGIAMLAVGEVLEPEKTQTDVVVQASLDDDDDLGKKFDLDFGQLEDLEPPT